MLDATVQTALCAALEKAINGALRYDPGSRQALTRLNGQVLMLDITRPRLPLYLVPGEEGVLILTQYESEVTTRIQGPLPSLIALARSKRLNLADSGVEVFGSTMLLMELQQLLGQLDIDWEDALNDVVGDLPGHQMAQGIRQLLGWAGHRRHTATRLLGEYLTEELRALPSRAELKHFYREVDELRLAADRLAVRIDTLRPPTGD